jgi:hypothetical protein
MCGIQRSLANLKKEVNSELREGVKFVFSSRTHIVLDHDFPAFVSIILDRENTSMDMTNYIQTEIRLREKDIDCKDEDTKRQLSDKVVSAIADRAGGMYVFH